MSHRKSSALEVGLIFCLFAIVSASPPPDVNEAHYLTLARHGWDARYCEGDLLFRGLAAHSTFNLLFGWLTVVVSLPAAAWIGRLVTWLLLAWAWQRMSGLFVPGRFLAVASSGIFATALGWGHMAGEWVLGGVEAKGLAYALVFLALGSLIRGRWNRVWLWLGLSSSLHVLVGGWAVVAALIAWILSPQSRPSLLSMSAALAGGLVLSLPGLLPALALSAQAGADMVSAANRIYVFERLPHHLVFHEFPAARIAAHLLLLLAGLVLSVRCHWSEAQLRLIRFVAGAVVIAGVGILIDWTMSRDPETAAGLLKYYWFRLSDAMVPLGVSLMAVAKLHQAWTQRSRFVVGLTAVVLLAVMIHTGRTVVVAWSDARPRAIKQGMPANESRSFSHRRYHDWRRVCAWLARNTPRDTIVLTPRHQQSLRWYGERAEVVNWKDIPQDTAGVLEWHRRMTEIYPPESVWRGLAGHGEAQLLELAKKYEFDYVLLDRSRSSRSLDFPRVFPPTSEECVYELYRVPERSQ